MKLLLTALCIVITVLTAVADDLYRVSVTSQYDAAALRQTEAAPVYRLGNDFLVVCYESEADALRSEGLKVDLVERNITADELAIDRSEEIDGLARPEAFFVEGNLRLCRIGPAQRDGTSLVPLTDYSVRVIYRPDFQVDERRLLAEEDLLALIANVKRDSLYYWVRHMQDGFETRLTGTSANWECSDWLKDRFQSFGYDSVYFDSFPGEQPYDYHKVFSRNVIAVKPGVTYPDRHIVVGAHFDDSAWPDGFGSPGADDNASGTAGVLEIARVLANIETDMTFIFVAFDSEESGLWGSKEYVDDALNRGDNIFFMLNMDMLGWYGNHPDYFPHVSLRGGPGIGFTEMCSRLFDTLVGFNGVIESYSTHSDHDPFVQAGFDATYVAEGIFNRFVHTPRDSTTYMNFDYMWPLVQVSLATAYTASLSGPVIITQSVFDVGDGQSLMVTWTPEEAIPIDHYEVYCTDAATLDCSILSTPSGDTSCVVNGLSEGHEYLLHVIAHDTDGRYSLAYNDVVGTPYSLPLLPEDQQASTLLNGVRLTWSDSNLELDFDHYAVVRDGSIIADPIYDTLFEDWDPALGADLHNYLVVAVDGEGNLSDTVGAQWLSMKAATLQAGRILAVNRTGAPNGLCDSSLTREFMIEALEGLNYDYMADPAPHSSPGLTELLDLVDYELVVIGAESGYGYDDIGGMVGILDQLEPYLALGGKLVAFGRWGGVAVDPPGDQIVWYTSYPQTVYKDYLNTFARSLPITGLKLSTLTMNSDFVGGHSVVPEYPSMTWDSAAAVRHNGSFGFKVGRGIPCPSIPVLYYSGIDTLYTYDSNRDSTFTEGRPVVWRYLGGPHQYVFFDLPLSFMERGPAVYALRQAMSDVGIDVGDDHDLDGIANDLDNCRFAANADQADSDGDGVGDVCDACPGYDDYADADGDYVADGCDVCPGFGDRVDLDSDGIPDGCDVCPGYDDMVDTDSDGLADGCDNCPQYANADQTDTDSDGVGDSCDVCPGYDDLIDPDGDALPNGCDNCPAVANADQIDSDTDGIGDACDACPGYDDLADADGDAVPDGCDICAGHDDNADADGDGVPDGCDICAGHDDFADSDGDSVPDGCDVCPGYDDAADADGDSVPDGCDACVGFDDLADFDEDTFADSCDNCPEVYNPEQADSDGDGIGDLCEGCCGVFTEGFTGNCNCSEDGQMTLSDVSRLIDRLYISKEELCCEANGNVNGSEDGLITLSDVTRLIDHIYISKGPTEPCP